MREMCLSLEHQNPSKTSEKWVIFSLHILQTAKQGIEGSQDRLDRHFVPQSPFGHPSGEVPCASEDMVCGY